MTLWICCGFAMDLLLDLNPSIPTASNCSIFPFVQTPPLTATAWFSMCPTTPLFTIGKELLPLANNFICNSAHCNGTETLIDMDVVGTALNSKTREFVSWMRSYTAKLAKEVFTKNDTSVSCLSLKPPQAACPSLPSTASPAHVPQVIVTGNFFFGVDTTQGTEHDLLLMDTIAFPIALAMLACVMKKRIWELRITVSFSSQLTLRSIPSHALQLRAAISAAAYSSRLEHCHQHPRLLHDHLPRRVGDRGRLLHAIPHDERDHCHVHRFVVQWCVCIICVCTMWAAGTVSSSYLSPQPSDYSLFLLTRVREELRSGRDMPDAVLYMLWSAGHTILVSGSTLSLCFFGLCAFPSVLFGQAAMEVQWLSQTRPAPLTLPPMHPIPFCAVPLLSTPGLGAGVAIAVALIVNLTFTPCMLLTFPNFFRRSAAKKYAVE